MRLSRIISGVATATLVISGQAVAQPVPHLTGNVSIGFAAGTVAGDVCVSRVPVRGDSATIVLNDALHIRGVSGAASPAAAVETEPGGGTVRHTFAGALGRVDRATGAVVADLCLTYEGALPVYDIAQEVFRDSDDANVIAFNGRALRARGVSRWYPAPFSAKEGIAIEAISFDLEVKCSDCGRIYVNGGRPVTDSSAVFQSEIPRELLLVAGDLPVFETDGWTLLGESVHPDTAAIFLSRLGEIRAFLESYVGADYGPPPVVIRLDAMSRPRRGAIWGFFSDPAFTLIGMSVGDFVRILEGPPTRSRRSIIGFLGHEMAHRYFGWSLGSGSSQRDLFGEPFAVYLEMKTLGYFLGEQEFQASARRLRDRVYRMEDQTPLFRATADDLATSGYRYAYAPLALLALEAAIGEPLMKRTLEILVSDPAAVRYGADFDHLIDAAARAGASDEALEYWRAVCLDGSVRANPCLLRIGD